MAGVHTFTLVIDHASPLLAARLLANGAMSRVVECAEHPGTYNMAAECSTLRDLTELVFKLRDVELAEGGAG